MTRILPLVVSLALFLGNPVMAVAQQESGTEAAGSAGLSVDTIKELEPLVTDSYMAIVDAVQQASVSFYEEGSVKGFDIDLSDYEETLVAEFMGWYIDESCGDRMQAESLMLVPADGHLDIQAEVKLMRYICTEVPMVVYHGFDPRIEKTKVETKLFGKIYPLKFQLTPMITHDGYEFNSDWISVGTVYPMEVDLVGSWNNYHEIGEELDATVLQSTMLAWEKVLREAQKALEGEAMLLDDVAFKREQDGALKLTVGFKQ